MSDAASGACKHMGHCRMYKLLKLEGALELWQTLYCKGTYVECARYKAVKEGRTVPDNLLPNGKTLSVVQR